MVRKILTCVLGCAALVVLSGCYTVRSYVVNKERVDQDIAGQPKDAPVKTRKVVVLEVIEKDKQGALPAETAKTPSVTASAQQEANFALPQSTPGVGTDAAPAAAPQVYVVEKDDTLQKISKKVYGSYSKWTKIYDANRDVIKDPNFLKMGVTLKIPVLENQPATENK